VKNKMWRVRGVWRTLQYQIQIPIINVQGNINSSRIINGCFFISFFLLRDDLFCEYQVDLLYGGYMSREWSLLLYCIMHLYILNIINIKLFMFNNRYSSLCKSTYKHSVKSAFTYVTSISAKRSSIFEFAATSL